MELGPLSIHIEEAKAIAIKHHIKWAHRSYSERIFKDAIITGYDLTQDKYIIVELLIRRVTDDSEFTQTLWINKLNKKVEKMQTIKNK